MVCLTVSEKLESWVKPHQLSVVWAEMFLAIVLGVEGVSFCEYFLIFFYYLRFLVMCLIHFDQNFFLFHSVPVTPQCFPPNFIYSLKEKRKLSKFG